jgi:endonuclease-3
MKTKKQINQELMIIHGLFPSNTTELIRETPFQLLIAVVLSAQSTDKQVNKITSVLFQIIKNPQDIIELGLDKLKEAIKSIGFFNNKAKNILTLSGQLLNEYNGIIPSSLAELVKLAGVGEKTAKVVMHQLYEGQYIAVDTHVHRIANRLWWVETKTPEQTSKLIEGFVYKENIYLAHHALILFWRYKCKAVRPLCESCPLQKNCIYFNTVMKFKLNKISL